MTKKQQILYSNHVEDLIKIKVESTQNLETIYALISGPLKIIHRNISSGRKTKNFEFDVKLTSDMTPTLSIIVYYIHDGGGEVVYDHLKVDIENHVENQVSIEESN